MNAKQTTAVVEQVTPLTDSILQVILKPQHYVEYQAGQYLQINLKGDALSYSIANAPLGSKKYELHIRHSQDNPCAQALLLEIKNKGEVQLQLPFGECDLSHMDNQKPVLFIAGGTGFAPIKAMIEQLLSDNTTRRFELYWSARTRNDLYLEKQVLEWQDHVERFQYVSLISTNTTDSLAAKALARHQQDLQHWQIVLSGPFNMVYSTRDALVAAGVLQQHLFSDAFRFEQI